MITTQILTKNNEESIQKTIDSLMGLPLDINIIDLGSNDKTIDICIKNKLKIFNTEFKFDYSEIRNKIIKNSHNDWQMYIAPWEILTEGKNLINEAIKNQKNYRFLVLNNDIITKELRLWRKSSGVYFNQPIYENIEHTNSVLLNTMIYSNSTKKIENIMEIINKWQDKEPTSHQPIYYLACTYLMNKKYDDFIRLADHYLFLKNRMDNNSLMIKYYCSKVHCYITKNPLKSISNIVECIAHYPVMAEFWCVLGDIYLHLREFERARGFYENAIILGNERPPDDNLPIEISKYEEYPKKMITAINSSKNNI